MNVKAEPVTPKTKLVRVRITQDQASVLRAVFARTESPSVRELEELSTQLSLTVKWIKNWFSRQRSMKRKKKSKRKGTNNTQSVDAPTFKTEYQDPVIPQDTAHALPSSDQTESPSFPSAKKSVHMQHCQDSTSPSQPSYVHGHCFPAFSSGPEKSPENATSEPGDLMSNSQKYLRNLYYAQPSALRPSESRALPLNDHRNYDNPPRSEVLTRDPLNFVPATGTDRAHTLLARSSLQNEKFTQRHKNDENLPMMLPTLLPCLEPAQFSNESMCNLQPQDLSYSHPLDFFQQSSFMAQLSNISLNNPVATIPEYPHDSHTISNRQLPTVHEPNNPGGFNRLHEGSTLGVAFPSFDPSFVSHDPFQAAIGLVLLSRLGFQWEQY